MRRILVVQPYVPEYRVPLFDYLRRCLPQIGFEFHVAAGRPRLDQQLRGDVSPPLAFTRQLDQLDLSLGSWDIHYKKVKPLLKELRPDMLVIEQAVKNLESWPLLLSRSSRRPLIGIWGQGDYYSHSPSPISKRMKLLMNQRGRWFFTYTQAGSDFIIEHGFPRDRVTILNNSTDTTQLRYDLLRVSSKQLGDLRTRYGLAEGKTALFMGGVDARKGIGFLVEAARIIGEADQHFKLLVVGEGGEVWRVKRAQAAGQPIRYLGRAEGLAKAEILAVSDFLMIPEWVGLVATDALAAGRPVVTTNHFSHAPEFAYLIDGLHRITTPHDVEIYAASIAELMKDQERLREMQQLSLTEGMTYSIEAMGEHFIQGIIEWVRKDLPCQ